MDLVVELGELRALARAVAVDGSLDVVLGEPGSGWFISAETGIINVDAADATRRHPDDVRGLICHEAAHAATTRYLHMMPMEALKRPGMASLMNSLEDCRIEDWLAARFPGTIPWIDLYNSRLFPPGAPHLGTQPWFQQYCLGLIHEWWHGELPPTLADEPRQALEVTREARQAVIGTQPPATADLDLMEVLAYDRCPARALFRHRDQFAPPDAFERVVRTRAFDAYRLTWTEIRPVYEDLMQRDSRTRQQQKDAEERFLRQLNELRNGAPLGRRSERGRRVKVPAHLALSDQPLPPASLLTPEELADLPEELRAQLEAAVDPAPRNAYETAQKEVMPLVDRMVAALERILRPSSYPRWLPGYPTGSRVDIHAAMTLEVEPGAYTRMWQRKTLPTKRDPAFLLLLDLSGSMQGPNIVHAFKGTVLMAEVLERLQIPFALHGFQDKLISFKEFAAPLDDTTRQRIGAMPDEVTGSRRGGHNQPQHNWDAPVLLDVAKRFDDYAASDRVLVVVSDGMPSGPWPDPEGQLRKAVAEVQRRFDLHLLGIGLGPGTDHVRKFYPDNLASVPLRVFPEELGRVLDNLIRGPAVGRAARLRR